MTIRPWPTALIAATTVLGVVQVTAQPQTAETSPRFEVASLKPTPPNVQGGGLIRPMPGNQGYIGTNLPLRSYLMIAYVVRDSQISGAPAWFDTERYDMNAKAEKPSTIDELHVMVQNLLADRCGLKIHKESKEVPGFALVIDKNEPKLTEHDPADHDYPPIAPIGPGKAQGTNAEMALFALFLSRGIDRPVVDRTGLKKHYDFTFEVVPDRIAGPDGQEKVVPPDGPMISEALKKQLGLRLEPIKLMSDHIVIDHVERPSGN